MIEYQPIFLSVGAALMYSLLWYSRQVVDPSVPTPVYDIWKLGATLVTGAAIGAVAIISGVDVTQASIEAQLLSYGFVIAAVEQVGKAFYRKIINV